LGINGLKAKVVWLV